MTTQLYRGSVASLVFRDGKILTVTNRRWGGFSCPGGKIDEGEDPEAAAKRELFEETGLLARSMRHAFGGIIYSQPQDAGPPWFCIAFEADVGDQEPRQMEEGTEPGWSTPTELLRDGLYAEWTCLMLDTLGLAYES